MGREIRKVPLGYIHPNNAKGQPQPMFDRTIEEARAEWDRDKALWDARKYPHASPESYNKYTFEEYHGERPDDEYAKYFRLEWPEDAVMGIQLWENTSEGTPQTPVFEDTPGGRAALCQYAANHCTTFASYTATAEEWCRMLFSDGLVSHTIETGHGNSITFI